MHCRTQNGLFLRMGNDDEKRWSEDDRNALKEIRRILKKEFASQPPFPEGFLNFNRI